MIRPLLLLLVIGIGVVAVAQGVSAAVSEKKAPPIHGLYKAVATENKDLTPGADCKFKFNGDGSFQFTQKTMEGTVITKGTYVVTGSQVKLKPAKDNASWPQFWHTPEFLSLNPDGSLRLDTLTFTPSLIGKAFIPGLYLCEKAPMEHYFFNESGGYKYKGQASSTGEYWVEQTKDETTGEDKVSLILNILRIDGRRVNYHQRIDLDQDGAFTLEKKYKYKRSAGSENGR